MPPRAELLRLCMPPRGDPSGPAPVYPPGGGGGTVGPETGKHLGPAPFPQCLVLCRISYHQIPIDNQNFQMSLYCAGNSYADGIIDYELFHEHARQFMASSFRPDGFDCLRDSFTGPYRTEATPRRWSRGHVLAPLRRETTTAPCCKKRSPLPRGNRPGWCGCWERAAWRRAAASGTSTAILPL